MGAFLDKPSTIKKNEKGGNNSYHYAVSMMQGWRLNMEDSHTAKLELPGLPNWSFFAVFDGHAGASVAEYSAENLVNSILSHANFQKYIADTDKEICDADVCSAIKESFLSIDVAMRDLPDFKNGVDRSGSTAVCVLVSPTKFYFANCGDSRAFLCRDSKVNFSTKDHKPVDPEEKERIENAGGSVMVRRINGTLAVSRALGDFEYKTDKNKEPTKQLVSPEPEVTTLNRDECDHFIVLACDGIFDVSSTEEVAEFVSSRMQISDDMVNVCNSVVDTSFNKVFSYKLNDSFSESKFCRILVIKLKEN